MSDTSTDPQTAAEDNPFCTCTDRSIGTTRWSYIVEKYVCRTCDKPRE